MRQSVKYMYAINSNWVSFDTMSSFKPFVTSLLLKEQMIKAFDEDISKSFENEYGFKLPYFILTNIVSSYILGGYAENLHGFLYFNLEKMKELPSLSFDEAKSFSKDFDDLITDFVNYCQTSTFTFKNAEQTIMNFIKEHDIQLMANGISTVQFEDMDEERYLFYEYLKEQSQNTTENYKFILRLCQGNLVKSYLFNEGVEQSDINNSILYLDSPIIYRLLGYYGEYYQEEYQYLLRLWSEQGVTLKIFRHCYEEVINLLDNSIKSMEDIHFNYIKASEITNYFRKIGLSSEDIELKKISLEKDLEQLNISICDIKITELDESFIENHEEIEKLIKEKYFSSKNYTQESMNSISLSKMIEIDVKSIILSYGLRKNNTSRTFKDNKLFFVTKNTGLIGSVLEYNNNFYPKTISPVIRDSLIGMIACSNDMTKIHKMVEKSVISFCYSAHKPSRRVLEAFNTKIESMKNENSITDEQYLQLKHNKIILPNLVVLTNNNYTNVTYSTINKLLEQVTSEIIAPIKSQYEAELEQSKNVNKQISFEKEILSGNFNTLKETIGANEQKISSLTSKIDSHTEEIQNEILKEVNQFTKFVYFIARSVILFLMIALIVTNIIVFFKNTSITFGHYILLGYTILHLIISSLSFISPVAKDKIPFTKFFIKKGTAKIHKRYERFIIS